MIYHKVIDILDVPYVLLECGEKVCLHNTPRFESSLLCLKCSVRAKIKALAGVEIDVFLSKETLNKVYPRASWHSNGLTPKNPGELYVQVHFGQSEWFSLNLEGVREHSKVSTSNKILVGA